MDDEIGFSSLFGTQDEQLEEEIMEQQQTLLTLLLAYVAKKNAPAVRNSYVVYKQIDWNKHVSKLHLRGPKSFYCLYRMSYPSFAKLCDILRPSLQVNRVMSTRRTTTDPIDTEIIVAATLRWLSGSDYGAVAFMMGISVPSFYRITAKCMHALANCRELQIKFPSTDDELRELAKGFSKMSTDKVMTGCVGCLDGYLIRTEALRQKDAGDGNVRAFFNGHYYHYGVNVQACCDHLRRFTSVCVALPGGQLDVSAHKVNPFAKRIQSLPLGYFVAVDNAYSVTKHLLTPFSGNLKQQPRLGNFNFYLSQLRITIERAFGQVTSRFLILKRPLSYKLWKIKLIFVSCSILQNFCINRREEEFHIDGNEGDGSEGDSYDPFIDEPFRYVNAPDIPGESTLRRLLVNKIERNGLVRPFQNRERRINS